MKSETGDEKRSKFLVFERQQGYEVPVLLRGVGFSISRCSPDQYPKAVKKLELYVCMTYKIGSDVQECIMQDKVVFFESLELEENMSTAKKEM